MEAPKRVVLVEPGDILLIGNIGDFDPAEIEPVRAWVEKIGMRVALFPEAIDIDVLTAADRA